MGVPLQHVDRGQSGANMSRICALLMTSRSMTLGRSVSNLDARTPEACQWRRLTVNESKCAVLVTGMRLLGGAVQHGQHAQWEHVDEQDYEYVFRFPVHV
jgi:hypothetical protein